MSRITNNIPYDLEYIREHYFSDPGNRVAFKAHERVMRQDEFNDRLYLLESGQLDGYHELAGERIRLFTVEPDMFVGVHSFFSSTFKSGATVLARKASVLRFITFKSIDRDKLAHQFYQDFMPVVVHELFSRTLNLQQAALEKRDTLNRLIRHEKLASLGQMASGIAHELNNALSVLSRNTDWLCSNFQDIITFKDNREQKLLEDALLNGRALSTRDTRRLYKQLEKHTDYDRQSIQHLSEMNMKIDESGNKHVSPGYIKELYFKWQLATTLHDMSVSANQASQVIKSMRSLGSEPRKKVDKVSVCETINEALTLIYPQCRYIDLHIDIETDVKIQANPSELVQVWTNLLTNACHSLSHTETVNPEIYIHSFKRD